MSFRCKCNTGDIVESEWEYINNAWLSAITVCDQNLKPKPRLNSSKLYLFNNSDYVDYDDEDTEGTQHEVNNLIHFFNNEGIKFTKFSEIDSSDLRRIVNDATNKGVIVIPELESGDLNPDLSDEFRTILANWVASGGTLIGFDPGSGDIINVLNSTFNFSLDTNDLSGPINLTEAGSGISIFDGAINELPNNDATDALNSLNLPEGSVTIYSGSGNNQSVVTSIPYNNGQIYVLGWDWFDAAPAGEQDGGWNDILYRIINSKI